MSDNLFFKNKGPFNVQKIIDTCKAEKNLKSDLKVKIKNITDISRAQEGDITFLNSVKYKNSSLKSKATACITNKDLSKYLPKNCIKIIVKNVLLASSQTSKLFYPEADFDYLDQSLIFSEKVCNKYPKVIFGKK